MNLLLSCASKRTRTPKPQLHTKGYELLAETPLVDHQDWQRYTLSFRPTMDITYIYLEAYYSSDGVGAYNGNVLVDGMSGIVGCGEN